MKKHSLETHKAAQLLGKRGGTATLKKYGPKKLREWGKLGAEYGKLGGRPSKSKGAVRSKARQPKAGAVK
jgi:hypothetical protein